MSPVSREWAATFGGCPLAHVRSFFEVIGAPEPFVALVGCVKGHGSITLCSVDVCQRCADSRTDHYDRVMARSRVVPARITLLQLPPSGRLSWTHSGGVRPQPSGRASASPAAISVVTRTGDRRHPAARQLYERASLAGPIGGAASMSRGEREHLSSFPFGEAAPDSVRFMNLERMGSAGRHRRALEAHGLGLCLPSGPGGSAFPLRVEEEGTGHPATGCVQLPVPKIGVRAWKAPGVRHIDPLCRHQRWGVQRCRRSLLDRRNLHCSDKRCSDQHRRCQRDTHWCRTSRRRHTLSRRDPNCGDRIALVPAVPGIRARSTSRSNQTGVLLAGLTSSCPRRLSRDGRIRADPGAVDLQTLDRFSPFDKSLIMNFVDLDGDIFGVVETAGSPTIQLANCVVAHTTTGCDFRIRQWLNVEQRLLSAVSLVAIARFCPKRPLLGPYCRSAVGQGSGGSTCSEVHQPSTPSAGGIT